MTRVSVESVRYTVCATFDDPAIAQEWIDWLIGGHCEEVIAGGALNVEIVVLDEEALSYEVRYDFPDRATFEQYEAEHAPRLRAEGLEQFPPERGIIYARTVGAVLYSSG